jgi:pimeloyl-ACP methyl ester carboxylesterase
MRPLLFLCLSSLLFACAPSFQAPVPAPIPNPSALEAVKVEKNVIPGSLEPHTPSEFNKAIYLRYFASSTKTRAVLVLMPGFLGGAQNFDRLARTIVSSDPSLEVWAVDRRSNLLEDHSRLLEAYQKRDPMIAWQYMIRDAGKAGGFQARTARETAFMGYWGLKVHLEDLRAVVLKAREAAPKVFLGGHSLGASLVGLYAGWDFSGTPGFKSLDGIAMIDGVPGNAGNNPISEQQYLEGSNGFFGIRTAGVNELEAGTATPYFEALTYTPSSLAKLGAAALLAGFDPNGDSPGGIVEYPASNLAAAMITGDDNYALVNIRFLRVKQLAQNWQSMVWRSSSAVLRVFKPQKSSVHSSLQNASIGKYQTKTISSSTPTRSILPAVFGRRTPTFRNGIFQRA